MVDENKNVLIKLYIDDVLKESIEAKEHGSNFIDEKKLESVLSGAK